MLLLFAMCSKHPNVEESELANPLGGKDELIGFDSIRIISITLYDLDFVNIFDDHHWAFFQFPESDLHQLTLRDLAALGDKIFHQQLIDP